MRYIEFGGGEGRKKAINRIEGKSLGLSLLKVTQRVKARAEQDLLCSPAGPLPPVVGKDTGLKAGILGDNLDSTQCV